MLALFPLALHGGPLWEPLCYAQIGGLLFATVITLILVPVIYSIAVLDLKLVKWKGVPPPLLPPALPARWPSHTRDISDDAKQRGDRMMRVTSG